MRSPWWWVGWGTSVLDEVARLPQTLGALRGAVESLDDVSDQLETLSVLPAELAALTETLGRSIEALDHTLTTVDGALGPVAARVVHLDEAMGELGRDLGGFREALERTLPELAGVVGGMDDRLQRVEDVVSQLGEALLTVMGAIPGVRRALRDQRPSLGTGERHAKG